MRRGRGIGMRKGMREEPNEDEEGDREEEPRGKR